MLANIDAVSSRCLKNKKASVKKDNAYKLCVGKHAKHPLTSEYSQMTNKWGGPNSSLRPCGNLGKVRACNSAEIVWQN